MSIFISLGIYSQKGADGIINGDSDRKAAMEKMVSSVGDKFPLIINFPWKFMAMNQ